MLHVESLFFECPSDHRSGSSRPSQQSASASERYAASVQKNRQEKRLKRQAELLALQGRSRLPRTGCAPHQEPQLCSAGAQGKAGSTRKVGARFSLLLCVDDGGPSLTLGLRCSRFGRFPEDTAAVGTPVLEGKAARKPADVSMNR